MSIVNIPKTKNEYSISDVLIPVYIDCSGSTGTKTKYGKTIFTHEEEFAKNLKHANVYWDTTVKFQCNGPMGGTQPGCIFNDSRSKDMFEKSDIIMLMTDGEIDQRSVTEFSNRLNGYLNKALYVCVIVGRERKDLLDLNISVIAPMMLSANCLCLYYDGDNNKAYVIGSKGFITETYKNPTSQNNLQEFNMDVFKNIKYETTNVPSGYIVLSETQDYYRAVKTENLLIESNLLLLTESELETVIKHCVVANTMDKLRSLVSKLRNQEIGNVSSKIKENFPFKYCILRDDIINQMVKAYDISNIEEQKKLKLELDEIKELARDEEVKWMVYRKQNLDVIRKKWDTVRNIMSSFENTSNKYSLNNYNFSSNRAKRAELVDNSDMEEYENILDYENSPEIYCVIHMDNGPLVLWLKQYNDIEYTTNDFCMNFPLAHFPKLSSCLVSNSVCGHCAPCYLKYKNESIYREPIDGYIPVNWEGRNNIKFSFKVLCEIFGGNKMLSHLKMLLLSIVDDFEGKWLEHKHQKYIIDQLLNNIVSTDTLSEEGNKTKLINCIAIVSENEQNLLRQPLSAVLRILKFAALYTNKSKQQILCMLQKRFAYYMIEMYCNLIKYSNNVSSSSEDIERIIFESFCGIPTQNKYRSINIYSSDINELAKTLDHKPLVTQLCDIIGTPITDIITENILVNILWHLSTIKVHERPLTIYMNFMQNSKFFKKIGIVDGDHTDIYNHIYDKKFGRYVKSSSEGGFTPSYALYNGRNSCPSKFWFGRKLLVPQQYLNKYVNISELSEILRKSLVSEMQIYGSYYPTSTSRHVMLHKTVATVLEDHFKNENDYRIEMLIECFNIFRNTKGEYGNIYHESLWRSVSYAIKDFLKIRKYGPDYATGTDEDKTNEHKILSEIAYMGLQTQGSTVLLNENILKRFEPEIFYADKVENDEVEKELINQKYKNILIEDKNVKNNDNNIVNVHITEPIVFGDTSMSANKLSVWEKEQREIFSKISLNDNNK